MPRSRRLNFRLGAWGLALALWDIWQHIPRRQRKLILRQARKHGPRLARNAVNARRSRRGR
jgi:hypothetical protein